MELIKFKKKIKKKYNIKLKNNNLFILIYNYNKYFRKE